MQFKKVPLYSIKSNPSNPRVIKDDKFEKLVRSIRDFPQMLEIRPIVVNADGVVLGGNMRLKACMEAGLKEVPVIFANDLTEEQQREFIIKDNVGFGEWDWEILANEWDSEELEEWGLDVNFNIEEDEVKEDDFEGTDEGVKTDIVLGDIFEIGEHRLLCGDSFNIDHVDKLMGNLNASLCFTDPPYDIGNEDYSVNIQNYTKDAHVFVMHDDRGMVNYLRQSNLEFKQFFIANFGFASPRGNDPYLQHILISHEVNGNAIPHNNLHDSFRSIISMEYRHTIKDEKTGHNHQKPIEFVSKFIKHYSKKGDVVLDLFGGSGTTMVASHQMYRRAYLMELDPRFCQVIIDRMIKLDPDLEVKKNGVRYERVVQDS